MAKATWWLIFVLLASAPLIQAEDPPKTVPPKKKAAPNFINGRVGTPKRKPQKKKSKERRRRVESTVLSFNEAQSTMEIAYPKNQGASSGAWQMGDVVCAYQKRTKSKRACGEVIELKPGVVEVELFLVKKSPMKGDFVTLEKKRPASK